MPEIKTVKLANSVDSDEVAHNEQPHLDLLCLPSSLLILKMVWLGQNIFLNYADFNIIVGCVVL